VLVGTGVGLEREWSGQAMGPNARFAGLRTFLLLGLSGGVAGLLLSASDAMAGSVVIAGGMALTYAKIVRRGKWNAARTDLPIRARP
jgi:MgtC family